MEITKETQVADILEKYGDIAEVMGLFGIKRVGRYSLRAGSQGPHRRVGGAHPSRATGYLPENSTTGCGI